MAFHHHASPASPQLPNVRASRVQVAVFLPDMASRPTGGHGPETLFRGGSSQRLLSSSLERETKDGDMGQRKLEEALEHAQEHDAGRARPERLLALPTS